MPSKTIPSAGKKNKLVRVVSALPILAIGFAALKTFSTALDAIPRDGIVRETMVLHPGLVVPLQNHYTGWKRFDDFLALYASVFSGSIGEFDPVSRLQVLAFLADLVPIQVMMLVESARRGNVGTVAHLLPTLFLLLFQVFGMGLLAPIYFFIHYVQSPLDNYANASDRLTQTGAIKTIIPTVILTYIIPGIAMYTFPGLTNRQWINVVLWQPFPIYAALLQRLFGVFVEDITAESSITNPDPDLPYLRRAYGLSSAVAAGVHLYIRFAGPFPLKEVFFYDLRDPTAAVSVMTGSAKALRYDYICTFASIAIWVLLSFSDLKRDGKLAPGWGAVLGLFAGVTVVFGPGAAVATMWAWREEVLAATSVFVAEKKEI